MLSELWAEISNDLWFQVAMLLAIAIASSMIFVRVGLPKTVGQIAIGIIIGPSVLNLITISLNGTDGAGTTDIITLLATFGATVMLFVIGLECD
ncbi:MAG: cation:proton antiporter, partial [Thermoplasmata archaeon]|nr:cation:proton antiporter [Thermoplasmata archaeon]